jgi:hypothetical protein
MADLQDYKLSRSQGKNRKESEADDETGEGGKVAGREDQQTIPPAHCDAS